MSASKVYFTNLRVKAGDNLQTKLERLLRKAGLPAMDLEDKYVAVKIHFGEPGNLAYLRPNYARTVSDMIKYLGGKPFLTDCNTLYVGGRKNALDHLESAYQNGFNPYNTGCHVLIADGLKGTDDVYVPVENGEYVKEAKIGRAIMDADVFISMNHFKGHELAGFGGALKNIGMGCGSRAGKMEMHSAGKPYVNQDLFVRMAAYAPLFGNLTALHWAPDLIWFNNHESTCSINYYVQQAFACNAGTELLSSTLTGADIEDDTLSGRVGVGTWNTSATFDNLKIVDNTTGAVLAEEDFSSNNFAEHWITVSDGRWAVLDGELIQSSATTNTNLYNNTGTAAYFGEPGWTNYTYTVEATKNGGQEGFLIPFAVRDNKNNYFWNIGGWGNTVSCLQQVNENAKSGQLSGTVKNCRIEVGKKYSLRVVVTDTNIKCYIDDELYVDYNLPETTNAESYQVVSMDDAGDIIIKLVNVTDTPKTFAIDLKDAGTLAPVADLDLVAGTSMANDNVLGKPEAVTLQKLTVNNISSQFNYTVPMYSVSVLRIHPGE